MTWLSDTTAKVIPYMVYVSEYVHEREREREKGRSYSFALYDIIEAVALLVDAEPKLLRNIKTVLEAAKKGQRHIPT